MNRYELVKLYCTCLLPDVSFKKGQNEMQTFELDWLFALNFSRPCLQKRINERNLNGLE